MKPVLEFSLVAMAALAGSSIQAGEVVYSNLSSPLDTYIGGFSYAEVADEITLAEGARHFESISVAYAGFDFSGDETLTLRIYEMDGSLNSQGYVTPGTILYQTTVTIGETAGNVLTVADASVGLLPETIAVSLAFGGVDFTSTSSDAGPLLFGGPSIGEGWDDYWLRGSPEQDDPWTVFSLDENTPANFGIEIKATAVPDGDSYGPLGVLLAVAGVLATRRRPRTS